MGCVHKSCSSRGDSPISSVAASGLDVVGPRPQPLLILTTEYVQIPKMASNPVPAGQIIWCVGPRRKACLTFSGFESNMICLKGLAEI